MVFHFPHTGTDAGLAASIDENRALLRDFLAAAAAVLRPGGEVHVTLVRCPYGGARRASSRQTAPAPPSVLGAAFDFGAYPGYHHQATTRNTSSAPTSPPAASRMRGGGRYRAHLAEVDAEATTSSWPRRRPGRAGVAWFGVGGRTKLLALALGERRQAAWK